MGKIRAGLGPDPLTDHIFTGNKIDAFVPPLVLAADQMLDFGNFFFVHGFVPPIFIS